MNKCLTDEVDFRFRGNIMTPSKDQCNISFFMVSTCFLMVTCDQGALQNPPTRNLTMCYSKSAINLSDDICGDLCEKGAICSKESGACLCPREPTPTSLGGHFTHCTNWNYVEQSECKGKCTEERRNDSRVCWTFTVGNYCTCF